ncbi:MAG: hypothetical protein V4555_03015 [Acidobacteriota bacterium]
MKRLLQIVALVMAVSLTAGPVLAASGCGASACGQRTMVCCRHNQGMAAMVMAMGDCADDAAMMAAWQCPGGCCATVARPVAPLPVAVTAPIGRMMAAATVAWRDALRLPVAAPPPGRIAVPRRARYLLFRDLRI